MATTHRDDELNTAATHLLEECRMVLPGIQALFGFQLIAVFDDQFARLTQLEQQMHLVAISLVVVAIGLVMAPAAVHRQAARPAVNERFVHLGSRLLIASMVPLSLAICLEVYLVGQVVLRNSAASAAIALVLLGALCVLWVVLPRYERSHRR